MFENLDIRKARSFGRTLPAERSAKDDYWVQLAEKSLTVGWNSINTKALHKNLSFDVFVSYFSLAEAEFKDLDTQIKWKCRFMNDHNLWALEIIDSPNAEVLPEDAQAFFKSEEFKRFAKRAGDCITKALEMYRDIVQQHLENGDLMNVDPVKLERIINLIELAHAMDNMRQGKYELK